MNWLDITLLFLLLWAAVRGYRSGFIQQLIFWGSLFIALRIAGPVATIFNNFLMGMWEITYTRMLNFIVWIFAFILISSLFRFLLGNLLKILETALGIFNRLAGCVLSLVMMTIFLGLMMQLYTSLAPANRWDPLPKESVVSPYIVHVGRVLPIDKLEESIKELQKKVEVVVEESMPMDSEETSEE